MKRNYLKSQSSINNLMRIIIIVLSIFLSESIYAQVDNVNGIPIQFQLERKLQAGETGIGLNGTFNNWGNNYNRHPFPLTNIGNDTWVVTVPLLPDSARNRIHNGPGFYEYKFVTYSISGNDTSITAWIPDPLNPETDPQDNNNSILYLTDPKVYSLVPVNGTVMKDKMPLITGRIATGLKNHLNISSINFQIDGVAIPNSIQYFDSTTQTFTYQVQDEFSLGNHKIKLSIENDKGFLGTDSSSFTISNLILAAPYEFIFDPYSPSLKFLGDSISTVSIQGVFNNYGADPLTGPDADGLFKIKEVLPLGTKTEYQFIVKGASATTAYLNDPDNPHLNSDYNPYVIKQVTTVPSIEPTLLHQGTILAYPTGTVTIEAVITPNDTNTAIDLNSGKVYLDGTLISNTIDSTVAGYVVHSSANNLSVGRHILRFMVNDIHGNISKDSYSTFGVYSSNTGFHYVDAENDDDGPGSYIYPSTAASHSADIKSIDISTNNSNDSLEFTITMGAIDDYTRIGLEITNRLDGNYIDAMSNSTIKIPEWNNQGVFVTIAAPNSSQLSGGENKLYISRSPLQLGSNIIVNANAKTLSQFKFSISIADLENIMGSFTSKWFFGAYSYFGNTSGAIKVDGKLGGTSLVGNPNVYDYAFFANISVQHRLLSNYILPYFVGGPKEVIIGSENRGAVGITPNQISSSLTGRPVINILTNGGDWYEDTIRVYGQVNDNTISSASFHVKNGSLTFDTTVAVNNGLFTAKLHLTNGENIIGASVTKSLQTSYSKKVIFKYHRDFSTDIIIKYTINNNNVTLDASGSKNSENLPITFSWQTDPSYPASVNLSGTNSSTANFSSPSVDGEYYFTLRASTSEDTTWARAVIVVDSGQADTVNLKTWHSKWVDNAVVYEIYPHSFSLSSSLAAIVQAIPRLKNLGINCIWLMPIMPAASPHGYNITDYYNINPDYGTKQDFQNLINNAHQNGIKIMMDLVINHTSAVHPFMIDAYTYKHYSPYYNFYQWDLSGNYEYLFNWWDLPNINYEEKWVRDYLIRMVKYWVEDFNIDGYRCDVAWGVNDTRPSGPAFWQRFRNTLKNIKPDIFLLAEAQSDQLQYFNDKFDAGYDWPFFNKLKDVMNHNSNISSLDSLLEWYQGPDYLSYIRPFRFLENHDETRFISIYSAAQTKLAAAMLFTLPGVPLIYAGQEVGETTQRDMIGWNDVNNLQVYYQKLAKIRNTNSALRQGNLIKLNNSSPDSVYSYLRLSGDNKAMVINNFYGNSVNADVQIPNQNLQLDINKTWYLNDILNNTSEQIDASSFSNYSANLAPYESRIITIDNSPITYVREQTQVPLIYKLLQNYPNPFNPTTTILFEIPNTEKVKLDIFDILGRKIASLINNEVRQKGRYQVIWNGKNSFGEAVASGVYFYRLQSGNFVNVKKMIMLK